MASIKKILLMLYVFILIIPNYAQTIINKTAGIGFRVDDNHSSANFTDYAEIFRRYGCGFTFAINTGHAEIAKFDGLLNTIKYLRSLGNEMADHTPDHNTKYFYVDDITQYYGLEGVDHIVADKKKICLGIEKLYDTTYKDEGRINISGSTIISVNNGEFADPGSLHTFYIPSLKALYTFDTQYIQNYSSSDPDTIYNIKDFWGDSISLPPMQNVEYQKMGNYDVHMSHPGLTLMGKRTLELCNEYDLAPPTCWIQPGGYFPQVHREDVSLTYGLLGYKSGAVYPDEAYKEFNEYDPDNVRAYSMDWADFCEDFWPLDTVKSIIADRAARHFVSIGHSHFWDLFGGWDNYLNRTDSLLEWCKENSIPVRTYSEWADILYRTPQNPYCNIMPSLDVDIDGNKKPDGFTYTAPVIWDTLDGVTASSHKSLSVKLTGDVRTDIFKIDGLGGIEKGDNYFSFFAKGTPNTEVDLQLWFNEVREGISFKFVIKDTVWRKYDLTNSVNGHTLLVVPEKNSNVILTMTIAYMPSSGGFVKLSGLELRKNTEQNTPPPPWLGKPALNSGINKLTWENNTSDPSSVCIQRRLNPALPFITIDSSNSLKYNFNDNLALLPDSLRKYDSLTISYKIILYSNGSVSESNTEYLTVTPGEIWPLELNYFTCSSNFNAVKIKWENKSEKYNAGFTIERKRADKWEKAGFIPGEPESNASRSYIYNDELQFPCSRIKYRLKQTDIFGTTRYSDSITVNINTSGYELAQNYPNPFNSISNIRYSLSSPGDVTLTLYDILGRRVAVLVSQHKEPGNYEYRLDSRGLSSGIYVYVLKVNNFNKTKKMVVVK
jgi:hypothetical protein